MEAVPGHGSSPLSISMASSGLPLAAPSLSCVGDPQIWTQCSRWAPHRWHHTGPAVPHSAQCWATFQPRCLAAHLSANTSQHLREGFQQQPYPKGLIFCRFFPCLRWCSRADLTDDRGWCQEMQTFDFSSVKCTFFLILRTADPGIPRNICLPGSGAKGLNSKAVCGSCSVKVTAAQLCVTTLWDQVRSTFEYLISKKSKNEERKAPKRSSPEKQRARGQPESCWKGCAGNLREIVTLIGKENKEI